MTARWQEEYQEYLNESPGWRYTKFWRKDCKCAECGARARLELHHNSYRWHNKHKILRWFLPNLSDPVETLCQYHHEMRHK